MKYSVDVQSQNVVKNPQKVFSSLPVKRDNAKMKTVSLTIIAIMLVNFLYVCNEFASQGVF